MASVPLRLVLRSALQTLYTELRDGCREPLPGLSELERRRWLLEWLAAAQQRLAQLLALCAWLGRFNGNELLVSTRRLWSRVDAQAAALGAATDAVQALQVQQWGQWSRPLDVLSALQILNAGSYLALPGKIRHAGAAARLKLDTAEARERIGRAVDFRLFREPLPPHVLVRHDAALVELRAPGEFVAFVTLSNDSAQALWVLLGVEFLVSGVAGTLGSLDPDEAQLSALLDQGNQAIQEALDSGPLSALCRVLRSAAAELALKVLSAQFETLATSSAAGGGEWALTGLRATVTGPRRLWLRFWAASPEDVPNPVAAAAHASTAAGSDGPHTPASELPGLPCLEVWIDDVSRSGPRVAACLWDVDLSAASFVPSGSRAATARPTLPNDPVRMLLDVDPCALSGSSLLLEAVRRCVRVRLYALRGQLLRVPSRHWARRLLDIDVEEDAAGADLLQLRVMGQIVATVAVDSRAGHAMVNGLPRVCQVLQSRLTLRGDAVASDSAAMEDALLVVVRCGVLNALRQAACCLMALPPCPWARDTDEGSSATHDAWVLSAAREHVAAPALSEHLVFLLEARLDCECELSFALITAAAPTSGGHGAAANDEASTTPCTVYSTQRLNRLDLSIVPSAGRPPCKRRKRDAHLAPLPSVPADVAEQWALYQEMQYAVKAARSIVPWARLLRALECAQRSWLAGVGVRLRWTDGQPFTLDQVPPNGRGVQLIGLDDLFRAANATSNSVQPADAVAVSTLPDGGWRWEVAFPQCPSCLDPAASTEGRTKLVVGGEVVFRFVGDADAVALVVEHSCEVPAGVALLHTLHALALGVPHLLETMQDADVASRLEGVAPDQLRLRGGVSVSHTALDPDLVALSPLSMQRATHRRVVAVATPSMEAEKTVSLLRDKQSQAHKAERTSAPL